MSAISDTNTADKVIPVLIEALDHRFATAKAEAVIKLGDYGPAAEQAIPLIKLHLETSDERFCTKAREALAKIQQ